VLKEIFRVDFAMKSLRFLFCGLFLFLSFSSSVYAQTQALDELRSLRNYAQYVVQNPGTLSVFMIGVFDHGAMVLDSYIDAISQNNFPLFDSIGYRVNGYTEEQTPTRYGYDGFSTLVLVIIQEGLNAAAFRGVERPPTFEGSNQPLIFKVSDPLSLLFFPKGNGSDVPVTLIDLDYGSVALLLLSMLATVLVCAIAIGLIFWFCIFLYRKFKQLAR
jgi:hypothetical protein